MQLVKQFTFGSLFSGIGGLDLGLERAGMKCLWQVEKDSYCNKVLKKHWPKVRRYTDVKKVGKELESVDLICGGFPCQPVSVTGKRKGTKDERWLWPEFIRIIRILQPRYVLVENVPGLLTASQGGAAQEVFGDLASSGYDTRWNRVSAESVGAPHLRWRVFIVADAKSDLWRTSRDGRSESLNRGSQDVADANTRRLERTSAIFRGARNAVRCNRKTRQSQWSTEPNVGRVAHGIPSRVDRLKALGNAVVPQVAELVGREILKYATS